MKVKPCRFPTGSSHASIMHSPTMDSSSDASSLVEAEEDQGWLTVSPALGQVEYVVGLQRLGIHMAKLSSHWVFKPQGTCSLGGSIRKQRSALWNLTALCIIYPVFCNGYAWIKYGFQTGVSRDVPRIKNYWCIKAVLDFEVFRSRAPSKPEMGIVMDAFNQYFQAWWTLINRVHYIDLNYFQQFWGGCIKSPSQQFAGPCYPSQWLWCDLAPKKGGNSWTCPQDEILETW